MINNNIYLKKLFLIVSMIVVIVTSVRANGVFFAYEYSDSVTSEFSNLINYSDSVINNIDNIVSVSDSISNADSINNAVVANYIPTDSIALNKDSVSVNSDSLTSKNKSFLEAEVQYQARDSIVFYSNGTGFLYGDGQVKYLQSSPIELKAEYVRFKLDSATIYAIGGVDSAGNPIGNPIFSDNGQEYQSKYMSYNFKTHRAYVRGGVTRQDEGFIVADQTKMFEDQSFFLKDGKYTTCDNHDHPHFYLHITKGKLKPGSFIAAGPAYLVMQDVPLPIAVPFGFFPITNKYSSGVIMPQFGEDLERGLYLKNGGYYWAINDYVDLEILGEIYTKGTWAVSIASNYALRYKFHGSLSASFRQDVRGIKNMDNYSRSRNFGITWRHQQDAKASQYSSFSASVDFKTSGYNTSNINNYYNPSEMSSNITSSTVNYTQRFPDSQWSISANASLTQKTQDSTISITLPSLTVNLATIYPFRRKVQIGKERWYEKISLSYTMQFSNSISTKERLLFKSNFVKDWRNAIKHDLPIKASFSLFKYLNISLSQNYTERWYFNRILRDWDTPSQQEVCDTTYGFYRVYDFRTSASMNTKLYGYYTPIRKWFGDKVDRIRHVLTPSVSFSYNPDFSSPLFKFYRSYTKTIVDKNSMNGVSTEEVVYSPYSNGLYGVPGRGQSASLNFSLDNNVEMKIKDKSDSTGLSYKKVSLIDKLAVSWGYNFAADSMNWNNLSVSLRLKFTKKFSLSLNGSFDPYCYLPNEKGTIVRTNELRWNHGLPMHFLGTNTSFTYTFNNNTFKKKNKKKEVAEEESADDAFDPLNPNVGMDVDPITGLPRGNQKSNEEKEDKDKISNDDGYAPFEIPWSFTFVYQFGFRINSSKENYSEKLMAYKLKYYHSLTFNGSIQPTPKWRLTFTGSVDLEKFKVTTTTFSVYRDLHCWSLSASISPFGLYKSFMVSVGVNASMLKDIKYDKRSDASRNINWLEK